MYRVIQTVSGMDKGSNTDITYYHGDSLPEAMAAAAMASAGIGKPDAWYEIHSVSLHVET